SRPPGSPGSRGAQTAMISWLAQRAGQWAWLCTLYCKVICQHLAGPAGDRSRRDSSGGRPAKDILDLMPRHTGLVILAFWGAIVLLGAAAITVAWARLRHRRVVARRIVRGVLALTLAVLYLAVLVRLGWSQ